MQCPRCGKKLRVIDTCGQKVVYRKRSCDKCKITTITEERPAADQEQARLELNRLRKKEGAFR